MWRLSLFVAVGNVCAVPLREAAVPACSASGDGAPACGSALLQRVQELKLTRLGDDASYADVGGTSGQVARLGDEEVGVRPIRIPGHHRTAGGGDTDPEDGFPGRTVVKECETTVNAENIPKASVCPDTCSFWVESGTCEFQCVTEDGCGSGSDPTATIADNQTKNCRRCIIPGCDKCADVGDKCGKCSLGYNLLDDGTCVSSFESTWNFIFIAVGIVLAFIVAWYLHLRCRPISNQDGLELGRATRSRSKLHMPKDSPPGMGVENPDHHRSLWPLTTNLCEVPVAGPGTALHFTFQAYIIVWGAALCAIWYILAISTDPDLLRLGLRSATTPRELCRVVSWGHETQVNTMQTKVTFLATAYVVTFVSAVAHAIMQGRRAKRMADLGMDDFAAIFTGLPIQRGTERVEETTKDLIESITGKTLVGVSVCWDFQDKADDVAAIIDNDICAITDTSVMSADRAGGEEVGDPITDVLGPFKAIDGLCGFDGSVPEKPQHEDVVALLNGLETSGVAFAVFENPVARDEAVTFANQNQSPDSGNVHAYRNAWEPDTVIWENFVQKKANIFLNLSIGVICIFFALALWCTVFYLPFAYYMSSFSYAQGEEPGFLPGFVFSMLVVVGNLQMYNLCATISMKVGFQSDGHREAAYVVLYTLSCLLNVVADLAVTGFTSYKMMVGVGARTYDGKKLEDLESFEEIFESYSMQKSLGNQLYMYGFPSCFLLPFILEPIFTIIVPLDLASLLVRTHPEVRGSEAEKSLAISNPMDLGRYGDILLNVVISVLVLFFPGGYMLKTFGSMVLSHIYVYAYDQWRVLRAVPSFDYSSTKVDKCANMILIIPCGIFLSCLFFKANCQPDIQTTICARGNNLLAVMAAAFLGHAVVHWLVLEYFVPYMCQIDDVEFDSKNNYKDTAKETPVTWFSVNPVHCLRSKYVCKHEPSQVFFVKGKEHLQQANPAIGAYFEEQAAEAEAY